MKYETFDDKVAKKETYKTVSGTPYLEQYEYHVNKDGIRSLVKTDRKENVHARIQADYDSTDINKLMARFALGDSTAFDQRSGFYGDVTKLPSNYAELFNRVEECKQYFDHLPVDVKQLFDNSYEVFFASYGSKEFDDKINQYNERFKNHQYDSTVKEVDSVSPTEMTEVER